MNRLQSFITSILPERWAASLQEESQKWVMRCPCGHETSIWEMGGIRYKAAGRPKRFGWCAACGKKFWGTVEKKGAGSE